MSSNPFAALDDSGDEGAPKAKAPVAKKSNAEKIVPASKPDLKAKPKNNDRNTKHGRGGRPPVRDGKRVYDRRSGTGRGKEIKKGGGGARNWGNAKDEAKKAEGRINENEEVAPATDGNENPDVPAEEAKPEVEDNTMTLAEYMASKGKKEEAALRDVKNEFEGKAVAAKGDEEAFMVMGGGKKKKDKKKKEVEKKSVDVGFRVGNPNSDGGRGGRGRGGGRGDRRDGRGRGRGGKGGRGAGGRGPKTGGNKKPQGINVNDEGAFPSL